jgi:hypothetical protein
MKVEVVVAAAAGHRHEKLFETGSTSEWTMDGHNEISPRRTKCERREAHITYQRQQFAQSQHGVDNES